MAEPDGIHERIVAAADALFYGRGIQAVGMDQVRDASGVPLKRIYAEFPSKERLVLEVLGARHRLWERGIAEAAAKQDDPRGRLYWLHEVRLEHQPEPATDWEALLAGDAALTPLSIDRTHEPSLNHLSHLAERVTGLLGRG